MPELVLASTSPYRRALLTRLGLPFTCCAPACDEEALKDLSLDPVRLALMLAHAKAESIARARPEAVVLGSDQLVELDGEVLGKPGTPEGARAQLRRLAGRAHRLVTALVVHGPGERRTEHVELHTLTLRALSEPEIARYVDAERPFDCAGSYKIESLGIALCERIEGGDFTAITGLPLMALVSQLRTLGFAVP